ncbi:unnamed protein product [Mortierella alpina]
MKSTIFVGLLLLYLCDVASCIANGLNVTHPTLAAADGATFLYSVLIKVWGGTCTGTIIGEKVILTAAHCIVTTRAAAYKIETANNCEDPEHLCNSGRMRSANPVVRVEKHGQYSGGSENDIALIFTQERFPEYRIAALLGYDVRRNYGENKYLIASWGPTVDVPLYPPPRVFPPPSEQLQFASASLAMRHDDEIPEVMLMAKSKYNATLVQGDSGSAIVRVTPNRGAEVVAVVSARTGDGVSAEPIYDHLTWIQDSLGLRRGDDACDRKSSKKGDERLQRPFAAYM